MLRTALLLAALLASAAASAQPARAPIASTEYKGLYERVLSLPNAVLMPQPGATASKATPLPVFGIYYVYGRKSVGGKEWVEIGANSRGPDGWIDAATSQAWTLMLVMQFAPPGQRGPVPFFRELDGLQTVINTPNLPLTLQRLTSEIKSGKAPELAALEPLDETHGAVTTRTNYYLMPVLAARPATVEFNGQDTTLVQVASLQAHEPQAPAPPRAQKIGMVFVLDTTTSMGKYIDLVRTFTGKVFSDMAGQAGTENVGIGILGYRNNIQLRPKLEYLTKQFLPLTNGMSAAALDATLAQVTEATTSSHSFSEDAYAGIYDALKSFDWEAYDTRIMFLLTDAGALRGNDKTAHYPNVDAVTLASLARTKNISIVPIHLQTPEATRARNVDGARSQYLQLSAAAAGSNSYVPIAGGSASILAARLGDLAGSLGTNLLQATRGKMERPTPSDDDKPDIGAVVLNELFAGQLRFLGDQNQTSAPVVRRAWASDRDLAALVDGRDTRGLDIKVFLTKAQLNDLGQHVQFILDGLSRSDNTASKVLNQLQSLATAMSADPGRFNGQFEQFGKSDVLPAYLAKLPYKSPVLRRTSQEWQAMGPGERDAFLDELRFKLTAYREFDLNQEAWTDLGSQSDLQKVLAIPLDLLP